MLHSFKLFTQFIKATTTATNKKDKHQKLTLQLQKIKQTWHPIRECYCTTKTWAMRLKWAKSRTLITEVKLWVSSLALTMKRLVFKFVMPVSACLLRRNYVIFYGLEVEVETMYFIVLTSIGRVPASEECVWKGRESWIIFSMLHVFTLIASCCDCVYECSQRSLLNSPGA